MLSCLPHSHDYLDDVPDSLFEVVVTLGVGELQQRCESVLYWRKSLLKGQLPRLFSWPLEPNYQIIINALELSEKYKLCLCNIEISDYFCLQILLFLDNDNKNLILLLPENNDSSAKKTIDTGQDKTSKNKLNNEYYKQSTQVDKKPLESFEKIGFLAEKLKADQQQILDIKLPENTLFKQDLEKLFKDYAVERVLGFDLTQGKWQRQTWKEILRCHKTIKHSPWLKNVIQKLGRAKEVKSIEADDKTLYLNSYTSTKQLSKHRSIQAPMEMRGIERNDDVARMLPSELSMLGHAKLKMLWHARRAERMLLSYKVDGVLSEHIPVHENNKSFPETPGKFINRQQGPVILVLDTSASMKGEPEHLAKAIVLESLRVCRQQQRLCYLFLFSGKGEIQQIFLDASKQSWLKILDLMQFSFHGGTQIEMVTLQALALLQQKKWQQADILMISDGRFSVSDSLLEKLHETRQAFGLNLLGINVGSWKDHAMQQMCDKVYHYPRLSERYFT